VCECLSEKQRHRQHLLELLSTGSKLLEVSTVTLLIKYQETFCRLNNSSTHLICISSEMQFYSCLCFFPLISFAQEHCKYFQSAMHHLKLSSQVLIFLVMLHCVATVPHNRYVF